MFLLICYELAGYLIAKYLHSFKTKTEKISKHFPWTLKSGGDNSLSIVMAKKIKHYVLMHDHTNKWLPVFFACLKPNLYFLGKKKPKNQNTTHKNKKIKNLQKTNKINQTQKAPKQPKPKSPQKTTTTNNKLQQ